MKVKALIQAKYMINNEIISWSCFWQASLSTAAGQSCSSSKVGEGHLRTHYSTSFLSLCLLAMGETNECWHSGLAHLCIFLQHDLSASDMFTTSTHTFFHAHFDMCKIITKDCGDHSSAVLWPVDVTALQPLPHQVGCNSEELPVTLSCVLDWF